MAARRCSTCAINYPTSVMRCHACGADTDWLNGAEADTDWQQEIDSRLAAPRTEEDRVEAWRIERCLDFGYSKLMALSLAVSGVDLHQLEDLIAAGCPLDLAAKII